MHRYLEFERIKTKNKFDSLPLFCLDIDECEMKTHTCDAIANSYCVNVKTILPTDTGYTCECQSGFRKVGKSCIHEGQRIIFQLDIN